jgi:enterochelin esterase-like enzyme
MTRSGGLGIVWRMFRRPRGLTPRRAALVAVFALAIVAVATAATVRSRSHRRHRSPANPSPPERLAVTCPSPALGGTARALVYLPAGYRGGSRRYPVIYFLHGLPANASSYKQNSFVADAVARGSEAAIVVAPQGARSDNEDHEYLDFGPEENWPLAIAGDLPRCIGRRFRTVAGRSGRALIGLSAGGYGAANIGLRNVATFGAVESWSGYFEATDPDGLHKLDLGSKEANELARAPRGAALRAAISAHPTFVGFYVGRQDSRFLDDNADFDRALTRAHIPHLFKTYPGGHSFSLWNGQARLWLGYALGALARHA